MVTDTLTDWLTDWLTDSEYRNPVHVRGLITATMSYMYMYMYMYVYIGVELSILSQLNWSQMYFHLCTADIVPCRVHEWISQQ